MTRKPHLTANWKMHKTIDETLLFIDELKGKLGSNVNVSIAPSFTALEKAAKTSDNTSLTIGAQNMHFEEKGAFTGEVSPLMIKDAGATFVILGHSERRVLFNEDNTLINKKVKSALSHYLNVILCIGESLAERESNKTDHVLKKQLDKCLEGVSDLTHVIIAYEPVWAIGTGKTATPLLAQETHFFIREHIKGLYGKDISDNLVVQYGGSVKPDNILELIEMPDIDGALIGGAALDVKSFLEIINKVSNI